MISKHSFLNTQQSRFLTACRRLEKKIVLPSILTHVIVDDVTLAVMKECGILGGQKCSDHSYILSGVETRNPQDLCPRCTSFVGANDPQPGHS